MTYTSTDQNETAARVTDDAVLAFALFDERDDAENLVAGLVAEASPDCTLVAIAASMATNSVAVLRADGVRAVTAASADIVDGDVASAAIEVSEAIAHRDVSRGQTVVLLVPGHSDCAAAAADHAAAGLPRSTTVIASPVSEPGAVLVHATRDATRISPQQVIAISFDLEAVAAPAGSVLSPSALLEFVAGQ